MTARKVRPIRPKSRGPFTLYHWQLPALYCRDCGYLVWLPHMPTYWLHGTRQLLCLFCAILHPDRGRVRPLYHHYESWIPGSGVLVSLDERRALLLALGARRTGRWDAQRQQEAA